MAPNFDLTATARGLLNIEVNTIIRDSIVADAMPPMPHALLDIAGWYADELCDLGIDLGNYFAPGAAEARQVVFGWVAPPSPSVALTVAEQTFDRLRWAAQRAIDSGAPERARISLSRRALLDRIVNNCDTIKEIFRRFEKRFDVFLGLSRAELPQPIRPASYTVSPDDLIQVQKIWDIGVEEIVAQTVVFLKGDITTRVQPAMRNPGSELLFAIHRQSVDVSVARWKDLLDAVREIAGTAVRALLGGKA